MMKIRYCLLLFMFSFFILIIFVNGVNADWWDSHWGNYVMITIDNSFIDDNLKNFPLFVNCTNTSIISQCENNGEDIRFVSLDNITEFYYEIEEWTPGGFTCWVNISEIISSGNDFSFLMYYNATGVGDNQHPGDVWDSHYMGVYHMTGTGWADIDDSTSNSNDADSDNGVLNYNNRGKMAGCVNFTDNSYIQIPDSNDFSFTDGANNDLPFTMELWCKNFVGDAVENEGLLSKWDDGGTQEWLIYMPLNTAKPRMYLRDQSASAAVSHAINDVITLGNISWHYIAFSYDGGETFNDILPYINGTFSNGPGSTGGNYVGMENRPTDVWIGSYHPNNLGWEGWLDEIRISNIQRNSAYINAVFNNTNQTIGFMSFSDEVIYVGPGGVSGYMFLHERNTLGIISLFISLLPFLVMLILYLSKKKMDGGKKNGNTY